MLVAGSARKRLAQVPCPRGAAAAESGSGCSALVPGLLCPPPV